MRKKRAESSYVARANLNASDATAQGFYDILSHQGRNNVQPRYLLTREVSPCLSPVTPYAGGAAGGTTILSHDNIPLVNSSILPITPEDESMLQLGVQQQSSKNTTFGQQARLSQKLRRSAVPIDPK